MVLIGPGCERKGIEVYRVPKESEATTQMAHEGHTHEAEPPMLPRIEWTLPAGWEERQASSMRVASFAVNQGGQKAEVSVIPLPAAAGQEADLVNMWRGQVGLAAATPEEIVKQGEEVRVGAEAGKLFDMAAEKSANDTNAALRVLVAMVIKDDNRWFFKMTGHEALVREQKPAFVEFLKSIKFTAPSEGLQLSKASRPVSTNVKQVPRENSERPTWEIPPGWREVPGGQMLVAKFVIGGEDAKAELNVSQLSGTGGGILANINRWRGQLGLSPLAETDLKQQLQSLDVPGGKAMLIDMTGNDPKTGQKARLLGAIVPQADQSWFYKLMGNEQVVEREREVFTRFLQSTKYSNVP